MVYVYNPSPIVLSIVVNQVSVGTTAVALPAPYYTPATIPVPYGPTGVPPQGYPPTQPHFVPGANQLYTSYSSLDPNFPILGLDATFKFNLNTPVLEDLLLFCFRNLLWVMDQFGHTLQTVNAS